LKSVVLPADFGRVGLSSHTAQAMLGDLPMWLPKPLPAAYPT